MKQLRLYSNCTAAMRAPSRSHSSRFKWGSLIVVTLVALCAAAFESHHAITSHLHSFADLAPGGLLCAFPIGGLLSFDTLGSKRLFFFEPDKGAKGGSAAVEDGDDYKPKD